MNKRKFFITLLILCLTFFGAAKSLAAQEKTSIRVGLSNSSFSTFEFTETIILTTAGTTLNDMASGKKIVEIQADTEIQAQMKDGLFDININGKEALKGLKGPIVIVSGGKLGIKGLNRKGNPAYYKGMIELKTAIPETRGKFNIINVLDFQTYLKGVVPNETPISFGLNALKAQAVAARNYASRPQSYKNYDICDSTACQVYYGANSQTPISDRAVDETLGIYALYNHEPILALYSSTGGGITEDWEQVYGTGIGNSKPYLKSVKDNNSLETPKTEEELKEFYTKNIPSFDMKSPKHRWKVEFDRFELEDVLNETLKSQSKGGLVTPAFTENDTLYGLEDIKVIKRGASGKALEVEIRSMAGNWRVKKELGIRRVFKKGNSILWSANFVIEKKNTKKYEKQELETLNPDETSDTEKLISQNQGNGSIFPFTKPENTDSIMKTADVKNDSEEIEKKRVYRNRLGLALPDTFSFFGAGFGHGVGLSQYGAGFLSAQGVGYDGILKHYYSGITLGTTVTDVYYNNYNQNYVQHMYVDSLNTGTAGVLNSSVNQNPLKEEILSLYEASKRPGKYILNIDNSKRPSFIEFNVNEFHFTPNMSEFRGKIIKTDITKYLKPGKNTITFMPLKAADKDKRAAFWVEIEK